MQDLSFRSVSKQIVSKREKVNFDILVSNIIIIIRCKGEQMYEIWRIQ